MKRDHHPDCWVLVTIDFPGRKETKVLAGWFGGYLEGSHWRLNSGIKSVTRDQDYYIVEGNSGSIYTLHKNVEGVRLPIADRYQELLNVHGAKPITMNEYLKPVEVKGEAE